MRALTVPATSGIETREKIVYWHGELPPLAAEAVGKYVVEADSGRVLGTIAHKDELWNQCFEGLKREFQKRLEQEVQRLGGDYAHVLGESVESKHDECSGESWLHGRLTYVLFRRGASN